MSAKNQNALKKAFLLIFYILSLFCIAQGQGVVRPALSLVDNEHLEKQKNLYLLQDANVLPLVKKLIVQADSFLLAVPVSVVQKKKLPPSGDRHDYMSQAPYWWPDSSQVSGLPYLKKDGKKNPEIDSIPDNKYFVDLEKKCRILSLAYYFTENKVYAAKAALILRIWFLNTDTKMNPNLSYSGSIPGVNGGLGTSIIDSRILVNLADWITLLQPSSSLSQTEFSNLKKWYADFLFWMRASKNGITERNLKNNRGTYFDLQMVSYALFTGNKVIADSVLSACKTRIFEQMDPAGKQPLELSRANAYSYCSFNLSAWVDLALLAQQVKVDLWAYETSDGKNLRKAINWLAPYAIGEKAALLDSTYTWDINVFRTLSCAAMHYEDSYYTLKAMAFAADHKLAKLKTFPHYLYTSTLPTREG